MQQHESSSAGGHGDKQKFGTVYRFIIAAGIAAGEPNADPSDASRCTVTQTLHVATLGAGDDYQVRVTVHFTRRADGELAAEVIDISEEPPD